MESPTREMKPSLSVKARRTRSLAIGLSSRFASTSKLCSNSRNTTSGMCPVTSIFDLLLFTGIVDDMLTRFGAAPNWIGSVASTNPIALLPRKKKGENQSPPFFPKSWDSYFAGAGAGAGAAIGASSFGAFFAFFAFFFVAFFSFAGFSGAAAGFSGAAAGGAAGACAKPVAAKATAITTANTNINTFFILPYLRLSYLITSWKV